MCRAAERPRPVLLPVIMIVWSVKGWCGTGGGGDEALVVEWRKERR